MSYYARPVTLAVSAAACIRLSAAGVCMTHFNTGVADTITAVAALRRGSRFPAAVVQD